MFEARGADVAVGQKMFGHYTTLHYTQLQYALFHYTILYIAV